MSTLILKKRALYRKIGQCVRVIDIHVYNGGRYHSWCLLNTSSCVQEKSITHHMLYFTPTRDYSKHVTHILTCLNGYELV